MAIGDDAISAGMTLVNGAAAGSAAAIDDYINRAEDYIANGPTYWKPSVVVGIADGGTGATTASAARTALGIPTSAAAVGAAADGIGTGLVFTSPGFGRIVWAAPGVSGGTELANNGVANDRVLKAGDTMTGDLYIPGASAAVSSFTVCYINGDGRVSRGSSSERYKKYISKVDPLEQGNLFPDLYRYQMKSLDGTGDGAWMLGHIAERLAENPDQERFVVRIDGEVESIDFIQLLLAQTAQLHAENTALQERVDGFEARLSALEGTK